MNHGTSVSCGRGLRLPLHLRVISLLTQFNNPHAAGGDFAAERVIFWFELVGGEQAVAGRLDWDSRANGDGAILAKVGGRDALLRLVLAGGVEERDEPAGLRAVDEPLHIALHFDWHQAVREMGDQTRDDGDRSTVDAQAVRDRQIDEPPLAAVDRDTELLIDRSLREDSLRFAAGEDRFEAETL